MNKEVFEPMIFPDFQESVSELKIFPDRQISLKPVYCACVSGGKDSLYMLKYILAHLDIYPLDCVLHFELEIDFPFVKNIISFMEAECNKYGIPFYRIPPKKTWEDLFYTTYENGDIWGFPTRKARWCNSKYKLSCREAFDRILRSKGCYAVYYIGYCIDETDRYDKRISRYVSERYPLVEAGIFEDYILTWAKKQEIFNNFYISNKRMGCMYCPLSSMISFAYLYKYFPDNFSYMIGKMRETEKVRSERLGRSFSIIGGRSKYDSAYLENIIKTKWIKKLNFLESEYFRTVS